MHSPMSIYRKTHSARHAHFLPAVFVSVSFSTFFTIFCSSIRKARTILSRTQLLHLDPPYALETFFFDLEVVAYSRGRRAGTCWVEDSAQYTFRWHSVCLDEEHTPGSLMPQSPHLGAVPRFLMWRYRSLPPGVLVMRTLLERVL